MTLKIHLVPDLHIMQTVAISGMTHSRVSSRRTAFDKMAESITLSNATIAVTSQIYDAVKKYLNNDQVIALDGIIELDKTTQGVGGHTPENSPIECARVRRYPIDNFVIIVSDDLVNEDNVSDMKKNVRVVDCDEFVASYGVARRLAKSLSTRTDMGFELALILVFFR